MDLERKRRISELSQLLWKRPRDEWHDLLLEPSGDDPHLVREAIEEARHCEDGDFPDGADFAKLLDLTPIPEAIGQYEIVREIGRGGMGIVYEGRIAGHEFERRVAIKVMKPGSGGGYLLETFRRERRALGLLTHPNIVLICEDGMTTDGDPYFVMEYLDEALPITDYAEAHNLSVVEKLRLLEMVCLSVDHAHGKGVLHCDLKPSNILVLPNGDVKIVDFGVSKLIEDDSQPHPADGGEGPVWMATLDFCSPEQLRGDSSTAQSDVYALGVVLYELLAGKKPHDLSSLSVTEVYRLKCKHDPAPPSTVSNREAQQSYDPDTLDRIALRALSRTREGRYPTAYHLAAEINRFLSEPNRCRSIWALRLPIGAITILSVGFLAARFTAPPTVVLREMAPIANQRSSPGLASSPARSDAMSLESGTNADNRIGNMPAASVELAALLLCEEKRSVPGRSAWDAAKRPATPCSEDASVRALRDLDDSASRRQLEAEILLAYVYKFGRARLDLIRPKH